MVLKNISLLNSPCFVPVGKSCIFINLFQMLLISGTMVSLDEKAPWRRESKKLVQLLRGFLHLIVQAVWHLLMICNTLFLPSNLFTFTTKCPSLCEPVRSSASCKLPVAPRAMIIALAEETERSTVLHIAREHKGSPTAVCLVCIL